MSPSHDVTVTNSQVRTKSEDLHPLPLSPKTTIFSWDSNHPQISIQSWGTSYHPRLFWMTILLLKQPWFFPWSLGDHDVPARLRRPLGQVASCCRFCGINFSTHDLKYGSHPRSGGSKYTWRQRRTKGHVKGTWNGGTLPYIKIIKPYSGDIST